MPCEVYEPNVVICRPEPTQPAMDWTETIHLGNDTHTSRITLPPFLLLYTQCCRKPRWAARCLVIPGGGWYAPTYLCAPGHGCEEKRR